MAVYVPVNFQNIDIGDVIIAESLNNPNFRFSGTVLNNINQTLILQLNQPGPFGEAIGQQRILNMNQYSFQKLVNNPNAAMGGGGGGQVFPNNNNVNMIGARRRRRSNKSKKSKKSKKSRKGKSRKDRKH